MTYGSVGAVEDGARARPCGTVRYWASARAAAGVDEDQVTAGTVAEALAVVTERHGARPALADVLSVSSFVVDGRPVGRRLRGEITLGDGWVIEVLPPFAGG